MSDPAHNTRAFLMNLVNQTLTYFDYPSSLAGSFFNIYFPEAYFTAKRSYGQMVVGVDSFYPLFVAVTKPDKADW